MSRIGKRFSLNHALLSVVNVVECCARVALVWPRPKILPWQTNSLAENSSSD